MPYCVDRRGFLYGAAGSLVVADNPAYAAAYTGIRKRALLVGVQGYSRPGRTDGAAEINTAEDVRRLRDVLSRVHQFDEITVLSTPGETTKRSILAALDRFIATAQPNDILYFHYSGHGSQVLDPKDPSGFDQTLVPSDYVSLTDGSRDITDKEIARSLAAANTKQLTAFLLTFDSCHSGTITRNVGPKTRGFDRVSIMDLQAKLKRRGPILTLTSLGNQHFTVISACRSDEADVETEDRGVKLGSLSCALAHSLATATSDTSYRDLYYQIVSDMSAKGLGQTPQIEGPLDDALLGGKIVEPRRYIEIETKSIDNQPTVVLKAGTLVGVGKGAAAAIYASSDAAFRTPLATAKVRDTGLLESVLDVNYSPGKQLSDLMAGRAIMTALTYEESPMRVDISTVKHHPRYKDIAARLGGLAKTGIIAVTEGPGWDVQVCTAPSAFPDVTQVKRGPRPDQWIVTGKRINGAPWTTSIYGANPGAQDHVALVRGADRALLSVADGNSTFQQSLANDRWLADRITEAIRRESRRRVLMSLPGKSAGHNLRVELQVVLVEVTKIKNEPDKYRWRRDIRVLDPVAGGEIRPMVGQHFRLQIRNRGQRPVYVTIADLSPDGSVAPLWPTFKVSVPNLIPVGDAWIPIEVDENVHAVYEVTEPIGQETFLTIATDRKANFAPLFDLPMLANRGLPSPGSPGAAEMADPFGRLLANASTRSATCRTTVGVNWKAIPFPLNVQPAK